VREVVILHVLAGGRGVNEARSWGTKAWAFFYLSKGKGHEMNIFLKALKFEAVLFE
jgi:hypothetical protein